jgi:hypothetical protein
MDIPAQSFARALLGFLATLALTMTVMIVLAARSL